MNTTIQQVEKPSESVAEKVAENAIEIINLTHHYGDNRVLHGVNLDIKKGETLVVLGGSGCGKSTFLRLLVGLLDAQPEPKTVSRRSKKEISPTIIRIFGDDLTQMDELELNEVRKNFGMLFQSSALFNSMSIGENVALPLVEHKKLHPNLIKIMIRMKLDLVGLGWENDWLDEDQFENKKPSQLSGGQKKRAGLARALIMEPKILFFDEPHAGLDPIVSAGLDESILNLKKAFPEMTMVVVTHEMKSAFTIADRMIMFDLGRIIAMGKPETMKDLIIFSSVHQMDEILKVSSFEEACKVFEQSPGCSTESDIFHERVTRLRLFFMNVDNSGEGIRGRKDRLKKVLWYETKEEREAGFQRVKQFFEGRAETKESGESDLLRNLLQ